MSSFAKLSLVLFTVLLAHFTLALGTQDPELQQCKHQCRAQQQYGQQETEACLRKCEEYAREKQGGAELGREKDSGERQNSPYVFEERHFDTKMQTEHGKIRILQRFTERSDLLRGVENFRVECMEAGPQTFMVPLHKDADAVIFVVDGRGTVSMVKQDKKESFNIKRGDIFRIRAGTIHYLINTDSNQRLVLAKLIQPVNTPGQFETFFGAGGKNPESFFNAFSDELLEAAYNTKSDRLQKVFGQQKQGAILKASEEQIRSMSQQEEEGGGVWPFKGEEGKCTCNIYQQKPTYSNQYGQLFDVDSTHFQQLRDLDIAISLANITKGAMTAPAYNSKATKISVVVEGEGYLEMACPHLSQEKGSQRESSEGPHYQKISSPLKRGTVVVVPAGHPLVVVASKNNNLQLLCFEINQQNNEKFVLAGKKNVMKHLEKEAKELAFGVPASEVDKIFNSQEEEYFFKGPRQEHEGRADA